MGLRTEICSKKSPAFIFTVINKPCYSHRNTRTCNWTSLVCDTLICWASSQGGSRRTCYLPTARAAGGFAPSPRNTCSYAPFAFICVVLWVHGSILHLKPSRVEIFAMCESADMQNRKGQSACFVYSRKEGRNWRGVPGVISGTRYSPLLFIPVVQLLW